MNGGGVHGMHPSVVHSTNTECDESSRQKQPPVSGLLESDNVRIDGCTSHRRVWDHLSRQ